MILKVCGTLEIRECDFFIHDYRKLNGPTIAFIFKKTENSKRCLLKAVRVFYHISYFPLLFYRTII